MIDQITSHVQHYIPEGDGYIPAEQWGRDHWQTFAYLETCAVDNQGKIENMRMRCDARLHREFAHMGSFLTRLTDGKGHPTRLKEAEQANHDDWSCLEDMIAAGLLESTFWRVASDQVFGHGRARVIFTPLGKLIAAQLRAHKIDGGSYANFAPALPVGFVWGFRVNGDQGEQNGE